MLVYGNYECFVMQMSYVCVLSASCGSSQCCILHDFQFGNAGQGCKKRPYGRGILQSRSHDCLIGSHEYLLLFTPSCCCGCFGFRGELGFLNCDDVCMCLVNKQFELLEFVFDSVYDDLQYDKISLTFTAGSVVMWSYLVCL